MSGFIVAHIKLYFKGSIEDQRKTADLEIRHWEPLDYHRSPFAPSQCLEMSKVTSFHLCSPLGMKSNNPWLAFNCTYFPSLLTLKKKKNSTTVRWRSKYFVIFSKKMMPLYVFGVNCAGGQSIQNMTSSLNLDMGYSNLKAMMKEWNWIDMPPKPSGKELRQC